MSTPGGTSNGVPREMLRLVHHHPGRLRVRAEAFVGGDDVVARVRSALEAMPGISAVDHNARTGSVLVHYEPGLAEPDTLIARVAEAAGLAGVVDEAIDRARRATPGGGVIATVRAIDVAARELSGGRVDLPMLIPVALAATSVYVFVKDKHPPRWPRWDNLAMWSYSVFVEWHRHQIDARRRGTDADDLAPPVT